MTKNQAVMAGMVAVVVAFLFPPTSIAGRSNRAGMLLDWKPIWGIDQHLTIDVPILLAELVAICVLTVGLAYISRSE